MRIAPEGRPFILGAAAIGIDLKKQLPLLVVHDLVEPRERAFHVDHRSLLLQQNLERGLRRCAHSGRHIADHRLRAYGGQPLEDLPVTLVAKLPRANSFRNPLDHCAVSQHHADKFPLGGGARAALSRSR